MSALNQYIPTNAAWTDKNGRLTAAAQVWLRELWLRTGGITSTVQVDGALAGAFLMNSGSDVSVDDFGIVPGPQGPQGAPGLSMFMQGDDGADGEMGPPGAKGVDGIVGVDGKMGPPGSDGTDGEDALFGPQGASGPVGATGPAGPASPYPFIGSVLAQVARKLRKSGRFVIDLPAGFPQSRVGKPVVITQGPGPYPGKGGRDEAEMAHLLCVGEVINSEQLEVRWISASPVRGTFRFNYLIGA